MRHVIHTLQHHTHVHTQYLYASIKHLPQLLSMHLSICSKTHHQANTHTQIHTYSIYRTHSAQRSFTSKTACGTTTATHFFLERGSYATMRSAGGR